MVEALFHSGDFSHGRSRARPYILSLLFKLGIENIAPCVGIGHSNQATVTIGMVTILTATTVTDTVSTATGETHVPTSYVWERRRPEPRGSIGNSSSIPISGCLQ
jgi:hypothetical protein